MHIPRWVWPLVCWFVRRRHPKATPLPSWLARQHADADVTWWTSSRRFKSEVIYKQSDQELLAWIAKNEEDWLLRADAARKLTDQAMLAEIARNASDAAVRMAAIGKLTDQAVLAEIAVDCRDARVARLDPLGAGLPRVRKAALDRLTDQAVLARVAANKEEFDEVRLVACLKLDDPTLRHELLDGIHVRVSRGGRPGCGHERCESVSSGTCASCGGTEPRNRCRDCGYSWSSHICN